jgi:hypothetical protein
MTVKHISRRRVVCQRAFFISRELVPHVLYAATYQEACFNVLGSLVAFKFITGVCQSVDRHTEYRGFKFD